ncbi:TrbI/VirB10 family protein [Burkholderia sp. MBR-1]|uniref:TrbI/VirB10 family protein n=1 Tax=Burkholderia sp. MBR-1 TaxID=2732364 RepID=UPI0015EEF1DA|nr:TrbI/VirB10 family protein [Burkholderia sp. MBR-1]QMI49773.1 conjugal transfer protein TraB [Burkholderia sp. MBR-1]
MKMIDNVRRTWSLASPTKRKRIILMLVCSGLGAVFFLVSKASHKPPAPQDTSLDMQVIAPPKKNIDIESLNATVTAQSRQLNDLLTRMATMGQDQKNANQALAQQIADVAQGKTADANLQKNIDTSVSTKVAEALAKQRGQNPMGTPGMVGVPGAPGSGLNPPLPDSGYSYPALPMGGASVPDASGADGGGGLRVSAGDDDTSTSGGAAAGAGGSGGTKGGKGGTAAPISVNNGNPNASSADRAGDKGDDGGQTWLTAGAMITGVFINGADVPTGQASQKMPSPTLIRVKKDAILPNMYRADIRECFILTSGFASMATERAYFRTERLSCVRNDGGVIETALDGYITGEDGKLGMRGRLVSKEGAVIARTLTAGFIGAFGKGLAAGLNGQSSTGGVTISTQNEGISTGKVVRGAVGQGIGDAFDKVADYYLDIAKEMVPVVEIDAGRAPTIILVHGVSLKYSQQR